MTILGGVQGLKRPDQLIPLNSQLKPKQMKEENKPESHPNLPNKASSNEAKSVTKTHVTKPVEKMESPVTNKMGGNGVAQPFVGNGLVNPQMTNSHELGKDIAIPTTSSYPSKQQQNIILNQLAKQSSQREYTKSEAEEQNHIVKDRIRSYENTTHSGGLGRGSKYSQEINMAFKYILRFIYINCHQIFCMNNCTNRLFSVI